MKLNDNTIKQSDLEAGNFTAGVGNLVDNKAAEASDIVSKAAEASKSNYDGWQVGSDDIQNIDEIVEGVLWKLFDCDNINVTGALSTFVDCCVIS